MKQYLCIEDGEQFLIDAKNEAAHLAAFNSSYESVEERANDS